MKNFTKWQSRLLQFVFAFALLIVGTESVSSQNLVLNGDFESWTGGVPDSWTTIESGITLLEETTEIHGGSSSASIEVTTGAQGDTDFRQTISVEKDKQYNVSVWIKHTEGNVKARLFIGTYADYSVNTNTTSWQELTGTYTATATGTIEIGLRFYDQTGFDNSEIVYVDDYSFTDASGGSTSLTIDNISQTPNSVITSSSTVSVSADITDNSGIFGAELHWGTTSGSLNTTIDMTGNGDTYTTNTDIPAQADGTTVYYEIYAMNNDGEETTSAEKSYTVSDPATTTIPYTETFDSDLGDCYTYSVSGDTKFWQNSSGVAQMNGYNSGDLETDWLILPGINLDNYTDEKITFTTKYKYGTDDVDNYLKLMYSTDYLGIGDPTSATWTELSYTQPAAADQESASGDISLDAISGTMVYIAFKYNYSSGKYRRWNIDNLSVQESADNQAPTATFVPENNATDIAIDVNPTITFNEDILKADGTAFATDEDVASLISFYETATTTNTVSFAATINGKVITITPTANLNNELSYTIKLAANSIEDAAGNENMEAAASFTTVAAPDTEAPTASFVPTNSSIGIAVTTNPTITFNEDVLKADGTLFATDEDVTSLISFYETITTTNTVVFSATINGKVITITPTANLNNELSYTIKLAANSVEDAAGNENVQATTVFTTEDSPNPEAPIATFAPANNATDIAIDTIPTITFNEDVLKADGTAFATDEDVTSLISFYETATTTNTVSFAATINGKVITITTEADLSYELSYTIKLAASSVEDAAGNENTETSVSFTTVAAPDIEAPTATFAPVNNATDIAIDTIPTITFNEDVLKADGTAFATDEDVTSLISFYETATPTNTISFAATINGKVITITPTANLNYELSYTIKLNANSVEDAAENENSESSVSFTTEAAIIVSSNSLIISQYYEGTSLNKWIEITNLGSQEIDLTEYHLGVWANTNTPAGEYLNGNALEGTIASGETKLYKNSSATTLPSYAVGTENAVCVFNGNDPVGLTKGSKNWEDRVDCIHANASKGYWGANTSFVRKSTITTGNTNISDLSGNGEWDIAGLDDVNNAAENTNERLGYHSAGPDTQAPTATFNPENDAIGVAVNINPTITFSENVLKADGTPFASNEDVTSLISFYETETTTNNVDFTASINENVVTVVPSSNLDGEKKYTLSLAANSVEDATGNENTESSVSFTTINASAPVITLTSPTGGEKLYAGEEANITWTSANISNVKIEIYLPSSNTWTELIASTDATDGTETVTIDANTEYGVDYKIRISDVTDATITDESQAFDIIANATNISDLRGKNIGDIVKLTGAATVTWVQTFRNQKVIQDASAGILIDDNDNIITSSYEIGDEMPSLEGSLGEFGNMLQFIPSADPGAASNTGLTVNPQEITISEFNTNFEEYEAELVQLNNVHFVGATGENVFENGNAYEIANSSDEKANFYTNFYDVDYIGTTVPTTSGNITGIAISKNSGEFVSSRSSSELAFGSATTFNVSFIVKNEDNELLEGVEVTFNNSTKSTNSEGKVVFSNIAPVADAEFSINFGSDYEEYNGTVTVVDQDVIVSVNLIYIGISDNEDLVFSVYPNPTNGEFTLSIGNNINDAAISINDISGRVIKRIQTNSVRTKINLSNQKSGIYFIKVNSDTKSCVAKIILK